MNQFAVKIIEDSVSPAGTRLTTMQLKYPRFIHAEAKTHRIIKNSGVEYEQVTLTQDESFMSDPNLSRNASSSRAIPVAKMIKQVREDPAMPIHWGKNQPGMQADEEHDALVILSAGGYRDSWSYTVSVQEAWKKAANQACDVAEAMMNAGYHKQVVNRLLEPFQFMHVVVTATEWDNFFKLRHHKDAQPEIFELAKLMRYNMDFSSPSLLFSGDWHLPYVRAEEYLKYPLEVLKKLSTARCARVSYLNHDGTNPDVQKDIALYDALVGSEPLHASPCEHQATPMVDFDEWSGNFKGWKQHRKEIEHLFA